MFCIAFALVIGSQLTLTHKMSVLTSQIANMMVHALTSAGHQHHHNLGDERRESPDGSSCKDECSSHHGTGEREVPPCPCHSIDPTADLEDLYSMAREIEGQGGHKWAGIQHNQDGGSVHNHDEHASHCIEDASMGSETEHDEAARAVNQKKLMVTSINTAVAIAFHNFPEGLATFVSALADPGVGAVLAVAIGE